MPLEQIENGVEREEEILQEQLSSGEITLEEYNRSIRQLHREAREYAREETEQSYEDYYHN